MCCVEKEDTPLFPQETESHAFLQNEQRSDLTGGDFVTILAADTKEETKKNYKTHMC